MSEYTEECVFNSNDECWLACKEKFIQQGREDAIDEMILDITSRMALLKMYADEDDRRGDTYTEHYHSGGIWELGIIRDRLEQIKEQKNEL